MVEQKIFSIKDLAPVISQMVSDGMKVKFTVTGNSMFPLFVSRRDQVTVSKPDVISKYDIVLHQRSDGTYILHRVISVKDGMLTIAGDNETTKEKNVSTSQVVAKVISFVRKGNVHSTESFLYKIYSRVRRALFPSRGAVLVTLILARRLLLGKK